MKAKYKYLFVILVAICLCFSRKKYKEKCENENAEKDKIIHKQEKALEVYKQWVQLYQKNKSIENYLIENDYRAVAIYGLGRVGKNLFEELSESKVTINYVIDKWISVSKGYYQSVLCYNPDAILPKADIIIITVAGEAEDITLNLTASGSPVISIQDLLQNIISGK